VNARFKLKRIIDTHAANRLATSSWRRSGYWCSFCGVILRIRTCWTLSAPGPPGSFT